MSKKNKISSNKSTFNWFNVVTNIFKHSCLKQSKIIKDIRSISQNNSIFAKEFFKSTNEISTLLDKNLIDNSSEHIVFYSNPHILYKYESYIKNGTIDGQIIIDYKHYRWLLRRDSGWLIISFFTDSEISQKLLNLYFININEFDKQYALYIQSRLLNLLQLSK